MEPAPARLVTSLVAAIVAISLQLAPAGAQPAATPATAGGTPNSPGPSAPPVPAGPTIPTPPPSPTPSPNPTPPPTPAPTPSPIPPPPATPPPSPTPSPTPNPYHYTYSPPPLVNPPADAGQILEVDLSDQTIVVPGHLGVRILTTANVTVVSIRAMGREIVMPKIAPGVFGADQDVPDVPFFFKNRSYNVDFIAATDSGRRTTVTIPVGIK